MRSIVTLIDIASPLLLSSIQRPLIAKSKVFGKRYFATTTIRMVEGPGVHRVAIAHRQLLVGQTYVASSPNGKFIEGAAAINGRVMAHIEAHGKNLFYFFTQEKVAKHGLEGIPSDVIVVHIHFGMSGSFYTFKFPGPVPRETTRLRLVNEQVGVVAHLSANLCKHGDLGLYREKIQGLGPDPLREDANKVFFWESLQKSKRTIGAVLMDQSLIAGIGNIYRTELLYVIGVHPNQPASSLNRTVFELLWSQAERFLRVGVVTGSIITVFLDETEEPAFKLRTERRNIYNHRNCRKCGGIILSWTIAQRTVYACDTCQPLLLSEKSNEKMETETATDVIHTSKRKDAKKTAKSDARIQAPSEQSISQQGKESRSMKQKTRNFVDHQAFKDTTTGGFMDFSGSFSDDALQLLDPRASLKVIHVKGTKKLSELTKIDTESNGDGQVMKVSAKNSFLEQGLGNKHLKDESNQKLSDKRRKQR